MRKFLFYIVVFIVAFSASSFLAYQLYWKPAEVTVSNEVKLNVNPENNISETENPVPQKVFDKNGEEIIWQGESGGFNIRWTDKDIYVEKNGKVKRLFTSFAKKYYDLNFKYELDYSMKSKKPVKTKRLSTCDISIAGQIASLVGKVMTLRIEESYMCGVIQYYNHWIVIDLEHLDKIQFTPDKNYFFAAQQKKLTDFFSDEKVLEAFLSNADVSEMIRIYENNNEYKSTPDLLNWFQKTTNFAQPNYKNPTIASDFEFKGLGGNNSLNNIAMSEFSFDRIENGKIVVQVALDPYSKDHRMNFLELFLDMPDNLREEFNLADSNQRGFFGKDSAKISKENWSSIYFDITKK